jgi:hypothetical protein
MATEKQIQANRNNAKKSTGPRTEEGKSRVSQNALKHGLLARDAVITGEDPAAYEAQLAALEADIQPDGALECELVRQMADAQWRMQRLARLEAAYLNSCLDNRRQIKAGAHPMPRHYSDEENTLMLGYSLMGNTTNRLSQLARYDAHLSRRFERAIQQIAKLREAREKRAHGSPQSNRRTPAGSVEPTAPALQEGVQTPPPEICETNPISSNQNGINEIAPANPREPHPAQPATSRSAPQPTGGRPHESLITPGNDSASRQNPLPR